MLVPQSTSNKSIGDKVNKKDHAHDHTPPLRQEPTNSCSRHDISQPVTSEDKTLSTRRYSARLTHQKPEISNTKDDARLM
jgi:hypothetical protein